MADAETKPVVRLLGYWRYVLPEEGYPGISAEAAAHWEQHRQAGLLWPDPQAFVDPDWDPDERRDVAHHLSIGTLVNQYRGISRCRFCGRENGSAELTDGVFCWPEGLAHYLREHDVRLPPAFVDHVLPLGTSTAELPSPHFNELGARDRTWPPPRLRHLLWTPQPRPDDRFRLFVNLDAEWWLEQAGPRTSAP